MYLDDSYIRNDKFEICQALLSHAVYSYFNRADNIALINTVHNCHSLIRDLTKYSNKKKLLKNLVPWTEETPERRETFERWNPVTKSASALSEMGNFVKHADRDAAEAIHVCSGKAALYLEGACLDFCKLYTALEDRNLIIKPQDREYSLAFIHAGHFLTWMNLTREILHIPSEPELSVDNAFIARHGLFSVGADFQDEMKAKILGLSLYLLSQHNMLSVLKKMTSEHMSELALNFGQYDRHKCYCGFAAAPVHAGLSQHYNQRTVPADFEFLLWTEGLETALSLYEEPSGEQNQNVELLKTIKSLWDDAPGLDPK